MTIKQKASGETLTQGLLNFVVNAPPTAPVISLAPQHPTHSDAVAVTIDVPATDAEGQTISYTYAWTVDGQLSAETGPTLPANLIKKGEIWTVTVAASDGISQSAAVSASVALL